MIWDNIRGWFSDIRERYRFLRDWNKNAKEAYIAGMIPILMEARTTIGTLDYRHEFSQWMAGGFRVKVLSGKAMSKDELMEIGQFIISDDVLVRKLVSNGWDTLEVHDTAGIIGLKWQLKKYTASLPSTPIIPKS
jgi:hypothetical protein